MSLLLGVQRLLDAVDVASVAFDALTSATKMSALQIRLRQSSLNAVLMTGSHCSVPSLEISDR